MKNVKEILQDLKRAGCRIERGEGSRAKIYPPIKTQPFYSFHISEKGLHPLRRFSRQHWGIDVAH